MVKGKGALVPEAERSGDLRRWLRRCVAVLVVGGAAAAVAAIDTGRVVATPGAGVVLVAGSGSSGALTLTNPSASATVTLASIARVGCGAAPTGALVGSATLAPGQARQFALGCPAGSAGMARCLFQASDPDGLSVGQWMGVCEDAVSPTLAAGSAVDFGTVTVGAPVVRTLALVNNGSAAVSALHFQLDDITGNFTIGAPCNPDAPYCDASVPPIAPGSATAITVACDPHQVGTFSAKLHVNTDQRSYLPPLTLSCTGGAAATPVIDLSPTAIDFPPIEVLGGSASATVHVANRGSGALIIANIQIDDVDAGASSDWSYVAAGACSGAIPPSCMLAQGDALDLAVTFDPSTLFTRRATLTINYIDTAPKSVSVPLGGTGQGATLDLADGLTSLDFGSVPLDTTSTMTFQLVNRGNRALTAAVTDMPSGAPFAVTPAPATSVAPTAPTTITAKCTPTSAGMFATTITTSGSDAFASQPIAIDAHCEGSTLPLTGNPTTLQLGEVRKGAGEVHTIALASTSTTSQVALSGSPMLETPNTNLVLGPLSAQSTPATFTVTVDPQHEGSLSNHILIATGAGDMLSIPVSGNVVTAAYAAPPALDLGTFCVGLPTSSSIVSLSSTGTGGIGLPSAPALALGAASPFELLLTAPTLYPAALAANGKASVAIRPARQATAAIETDTLTWHTDLADAPSFTTSITASFVDTGGAIAPGALEFAPVPIHLVTDNGQTVMIQNCSSVPLALTAMIKPPFVIDSPFPNTLRPAETQTFSVAFHPTEKGTFVDDLTITSPQLADALKVHLSGQGIVEDTGADGSITTPARPTGSFYGCGSCSSTSTLGGSAAGWLAVLLVLRRRRR